MSSSSFKSIYELDTSNPWDKYALLRILENATYSFDEQLELIPYIEKHFISEISPILDYYENPRLSDRIYRIMDDWDLAWRFIINGQTGKYQGYRKDLLALQTLCS